MKKIVGILAAAAIATSVFAADVSANVKLHSSLFNLKGDNMTALDELKNDATADYKPLFKLAVSGDNYGGSVVYYGEDDAGKKKLDYDKFNIWFKPADILKLSFKENGLSLAADKYNGYNANDPASVGGGYGLELTPADGITLNVNLAEKFLTNAGDTSVIGEIGFKFGYAADFGSIAAIADFKSDFKKYQFGAGYSGSFDAISVVFNVGYKNWYAGKDAAGKDADLDGMTVVIDPSAGGSMDAISWAIDVPVKLTGKDKITTGLGLKAKGTYALDSTKLTLKFEDGDLINGDFDATFGLDVEGNVGAASWKVAPSYNVGNETFGVAFETGIGF